MLTAKIINVEAEDWLYLKGLNINLSEQIRDFLHNLRIAKQSNVNGINIDLTRIELNDKISKIAILQAEVQNIKVLLEDYETKQKEATKMNLEKERERLEKMSRCANCGSTLTSKTTIELKKDVFLCKACFHDKSTAQRYLNKK